MRLKQLRGMPVVDPTTARKIGSVLDYQVDPVSGQVAAIDVGDVGGEARRIGAERIHRVGAAAVMLTAASAADPPVPAPVADDWLDAASLSGLEVMGVDGGRIGRLSDAAFNQDDLTIELERMSSQSDVDRELSRLKSEIAPAPQTPQIAPAAKKAETDPA